MVKREQPDDHEAAWQAIVDNYGERVLEAEDLPDPAPEPVAPAAREAEPELDEPDELTLDPDDRFVPPDPGPMPLPTADRLLAWIGVFGAPAVLLVCVVSGISLPELLGWGLVGWFLIGFGYLVMQMPTEPRDPWDNGAQL